MKKPVQNDIFKFRTRIRVKNYEIDWQGIVHNATYLLYFEEGRVEYLKNLGVKIDINSIQHEYKTVLVRNEIDYKSPAVFDEQLNVYTRISTIRNTSFTFEGIIEEATTKRLVAENVAVHVWLNPATNEPTRVSDEFRRLVHKYEGNNILIES
jgi:acyl-CoA thioester hydrolase